jgi:ankyrin repeat protein
MIFSSVCFVFFISKAPSLFSGAFQIMIGLVYWGHVSADPNKVCDNFPSALMKSNAESTDLLLKHGANPNYRDFQGFTPLTSQGEFGDVETIALLVKAGANVNAADSQGVTALIAAAKDRDPSKAAEKIAILLKAGANPNAVDENKKPALEYAASHGCSTEIDRPLSLLISAGATPTQATEIYCPQIPKEFNQHAR